MRRRQREDIGTVGNGGAVLTDAEIAAELNRRHGTTANNPKNVAATRWRAEQKLRRLLAGKLGPG